MPGVEQQPQARPEHAVVSEIEQAKSPVSRRQALELVRNFGKLSDPTVRDRLFQLIKAAAPSYSGKAEGEDAQPAAVPVAAPAGDEPARTGPGLFPTTCFCLPGQWMGVGEGQRVQVSV